MYKAIILGVMTFGATFLVSKAVVQAQTDTPTPIVTETTTVTPTPELPQGAPKTGFGGQ